MSFFDKYYSLPAQRNVIILSLIAFLLNVTGYIAVKLFYKSHSEVLFLFSIAYIVFITYFIITYIKNIRKLETFKNKLANNKIILIKAKFNVNAIKKNKIYRLINDSSITYQNQWVYEIIDNEDKTRFSPEYSTLNTLITKFDLYDIKTVRTLKLKKLKKWKILK